MRCHENGRSRGARRREYSRIRKERNAASGRSRGNPKLKIQSTGMPEIARMAASFVACLARPNGAPHSWPCERFQAFACTFPMQAGP